MLRFRFAQPSLPARGWRAAAFRGEGSSVGKLDETIARLDRGEFDLVAVGRALLQDSEWALKVKAARHDQLRDYDAKALQTYF